MASTNWKLLPWPSIALSAVIIATAVLAISLVRQAQAQTEPDEIDFTSFVAQMTVAPAPVLHSSSQVSLRLRATQEVTSTDVTLSLPVGLVVTGAWPDGSSTTQGGDPWNSHLQYVSWTAFPQVGVTKTFLISVTVSYDTAGLYDVIEGQISEVSDALYTDTRTAAFVRIGTTAAESDVTYQQPPLTEIIDYSTATYKVRDQFGQWSEVPPQAEPPLSALPLPKPVVSLLNFDHAPQPNTPVDLAWPIENTIDDPVSYSGALSLPSGWTLVSGSTMVAGIILPGGVVTHSLTVRPDDIGVDWTVTATLQDLTDTATLEEYPDYVIVQEGGVSHTGASWLAQQFVAIEPEGVPQGGGSTAMAGNTLAVGGYGALQGGIPDTCPTCLTVDGSFVGKRVQGTINMDDIPGASLRVEVVRLFHPGTIGINPIVGYIGETRTNADGNYEVVLCFQDENPWWIRVYTESTDEAWGQRSITVRDESGWFPVYRYAKGWYDMRDICELDVSCSISTKWADAFVIASAYGHDGRRFVQSQTSLDPYGGTFPFFAYWPYYDWGNPPLYNASRCWDNCWINAQHGRLFSILAHEYAHHTHYAAGGAYATQRFVEGWAIFQENVARELGYVRGHPSGAHIETKTHNGAVTGTVAIEGAAGYLWDLWDGVNTEPWDLQNCDDAVGDTTQTAFSHLLDEYADVVDLSELEGHAPGFYEQYAPVTENFRAISYNHNVAEDQAAQEACFPPP